MTRAKLFRILQAAVCVALAALLCASAIGVYRDGEARRAEDPMASVYTRKIAGERLAAIAPLALVAAALLVAGLAPGLRDEGAKRPGKAPEFTRDLLISKVREPSGAMRRERASQGRLRLLGLGAFAACMVPVAAYLLDSAHYPMGDLEGMFRGLLWTLLPWTAVGLGALAVTASLRERHIYREIEAAREQLRREAGQPARPEHVPPAPARRPRALQAALLAAAVALILLGIVNRSARDVLYKAITICTECIGLG